MTISGLENNYYLTQNDIWIRVDGFPEAVSILEVKATNLTSELILPPLKLSASPSNDFQFNICQLVRALMPEPNHLAINSLQSFQIEFKAKYVNTELPDDEDVLIKYFVRGGRDKNGNDEWFLQPSEELVVGRWIDWGIPLPTYAKRIQGDEIVDYIPNNQFKISLRNNCNYTAIKFLNSLGGYQYYIFESHEIKIKSKAGKTIPTIAYRLRNDNFINIGIEKEKTIELSTKTPFEVQSVISDLVGAFEVFLYNPEGFDENAKWQRLQLESNDSIENSYDRVYENTLKYSFAQTRTIEL